MIENDGRHITDAMERASCKKHGAPKGVPCWTLPKNVGNGFGRYAAICNARIKRAGYIGSISPSSLRRSAPRPVNERGPIARARSAFNKNNGTPPSAKKLAKPQVHRDFAFKPR
jgi:hypothetical protein